MQADLCSGFSTSDWNALSNRLDNNDEAAWSEAIGVFERRMKERFFRCIEALDQTRTPSSDSGIVERCVPGFAIMAICCLLVETIQGFREKPPANETAAANIFKKLLDLPQFGDSFSDGIAEKFLTGIRNGILHEAETRKWVIWRSQPEGKIVEARDDGYALNRSLFCAALKLVFESYLDELRDSTNHQKRSRFRKKMNDVCKES